MNKPVKYLLLASVVLLLAAPMVIMSRASTLIRDAVENYGPELIGAPVQLKRVTFSLIKGEAGLEGLVIGNPPGFKSDYSFSLAQLRIKLDPLSLFSERIEISKLVIIQPDLIWEIGKGGSNFQALQKNLPMVADPGASDSGPLVMIDHVYLNGTRVTIEGLPVSRDISLTLPDLHIENIGRDEGGVTFGNAMEEIIAVILPAVTRVALSQQIKGLPGDLAGDFAGDLEGEGGAVVKQLKDKLEDRLKRGLGGLLGGKDGGRDKAGEEGGN